MYTALEYCCNSTKNSSQGRCDCALCVGATSNSSAKEGTTKEATVSTRTLESLLQRPLLSNDEARLDPMYMLESNGITEPDYYEGWTLDQILDESNADIDRTVSSSDCFAESEKELHDYHRHQKGEYITEHSSKQRLAGEYYEQKHNRSWNNHTFAPSEKSCNHPLKRKTSQSSKKPQGQNEDNGLDERSKRPRFVDSIVAKNDDLESQSAVVSLLDIGNSIPVAADLVSVMLMMPDSTRDPKSPKAASPVPSDQQDNKEEADSGGNDWLEKTPQDLPRKTHNRPFQANQWALRFKDLQVFKKIPGHCLVPHRYEENVALARWVKRQRYQYKLYLDQDPTSTMTSKRVQILEEIGFVWDSQACLWAQKYEELQQYQAKHGHCNIPGSYQANPSLATWIKCQRRQYRLHRQGRPTHISSSRIRQLEAIGFQWELKSGYSRNLHSSKQEA